ncbi:MAG: hypothetical protein JSW61_06745 [Candidatus Thorarchaeota archaeon]|nr:MAG: hypothetical protein JSW61_06745 [Candidatus Thorarchaeota archaeon]
MIELVAYLLVYFGAGFMLKLGDDLLDELDRPDLAWYPLAVSGIFFGILMTTSEWDLVLLTAIIIGVLASGKVNRAQFLIGFAFIGLVFVLRFIITDWTLVVTSWLDWMALLVSLFLAAVLDELGNDWTNPELNPTAYLFFKYRFSLKCSVLLLAIFWPAFLLAAIGLWSFDLGYETTGWTLRVKVKIELDRQDYSKRP